MSPVKQIEESTSYSEAELIEIIEKGIPFNCYLGVQVESFSRGEIILRLAPKKEYTGDPSRPALHGGLIATLADTAAGLAVFTILKKPSTTSTIDLRVDYLRPGDIDQTLFAHSTVLRNGKRVCFTQTTLYQSSKDQPIAVSSATYSIVPHKDLPTHHVKDKSLDL